MVIFSDLSVYLHSMVIFSDLSVYLHSIVIFSDESLPTKQKKSRDEIEIVTHENES